MVWSAERAGREIDAIWEKRQAVERKRADYDDTLRAKLIEAKANYDGSFKEFVEKHTHISLTTAKRTLRIEDGRGEEVRQQERERQQRHRGRDNSPVTPLAPPMVPDAPATTTTLSEVVGRCMEVFEGDGTTAGQKGGARAVSKVLADHSVTDPHKIKPEQFASVMEALGNANCKRLARMTEAEFDKYLAAETNNIAERVAPLVPEPVEQFPVIDFSLAGKSVADIDRLFPGLDFNNDETLRFDDENIDLELYDLINGVGAKLHLIAQTMARVPAVAEAMQARRKAEHEADEAERKQKAEAARLARIEWEITHPDEARKAYYAQAFGQSER